MRPQILFSQNRSASNNRVIRTSQEQHFCKGYKHLSRSSEISKYVCFLENRKYTKK